MKSFPISTATHYINAPNKWWIRHIYRFCHLKDLFIPQLLVVICNLLNIISNISGVVCTYIIATKNWKCRVCRVLSSSIEIIKSICCNGCQMSVSVLFLFSCIMSKICLISLWTWNQCKRSEQWVISDLHMSLLQRTDGRTALVSVVGMTDWGWSPWMFTSFRPETLTRIIKQLNKLGARRETVRGEERD